ncbi:MAG: type II toxin-antitoxin system VapC family toxin [Gammaproteobacteria bacterium]|nr:type II toxin-antitoxin system VapC family toxin [Gammaproteobacteria bacterium]
MIADTSAVLAILFGEEDSDAYATAIAASSACRMSVASLLEASIVLETRGGHAAARELDSFVEAAGIELAPVSPEQAQAARQAWRLFGRGNHPAGLNFGDCFAYALASVTGEPLLFKGGDFAQTDIPAVLP